MPARRFPPPGPLRNWTLLRCSRPQRTEARLRLLRGRAQPAIRRQSLWGLSRRTRAIDHLLYESNSGFWRWVTGGCGNVLSIGVVVIASTRPPPKRLLGLGQP